MAKLSIAIVSDIHADERDGAFTHVVPEPPLPRRGMHPLRDLIRVLQSENIKSDYLVAPGDIANQADATGLIYGWRSLNQIADVLEAKLIAVPGNHDIITHSNEDDPRKLLKNLLPAFPVQDRLELVDKFWEDGWSLLDEDDHRFLLIDSTRTFPSIPVSPPDDSEEWVAYRKAIERGGISNATLAELELLFDTMAGDKLNIAVVHHHPQEHQMRSSLQDNYGPMERGGELLELLSSNAKCGRWMVIHGHKHVPQLVDSIGVTSNGPIVLCAGTVGAKLWPEISTVTRNQFHLMEICNDFSPGVGRLHGAIRTLTWGSGEGWYRTERQGAGLPAVGGFGCITSLDDLTKKITSFMEDESLAFISYRALVEHVPELPFQLPGHFESIQMSLETRGYEFSRNRRHEITQLSKVVTV
ncbi:metallophosphoesterase family protein [Gordonia terrae]